MTIHKLTLVNFRQFIGEQTVYFSTDKERNVTVFVGDNTSGKTTFINAFQWILYDNTAFTDKILLNKNVAKRNVCRREAEASAEHWSLSMMA